MSRAIVLGNGSLLVGLNDDGLVRDTYFDYVGLENHMMPDSLNRIGVWVEDPQVESQGKFSWVGEGWQIEINYKHETMASEIKAISEYLQIELNFTDVVYNEKNIFLRQIEVINQAQTKRKIKLFYNHQFRMYGTPKQDTAYWDPADNTIVHYKGRRIAVIGGKLKGGGIMERSAGLSNIEGKEGTWRDAEDGVLTNNPIEHGTVDSTVGFEQTVDAGEAFTHFVWVSLAKTIDEAKELNAYVVRKTPEHLIKTTIDFWRAWVNKMTMDFEDVSAEAIDLYKKSLFVIRTHVDNTGAIIASSDSDILFYGRDTYGYVWNRDAAFIAIALDKSGYHEVTRPFFEFCRDVIAPEGYFYHRYRCDRSRASSWHPWIGANARRILPIQEDETALVIYALWNHYDKTRDIEFIESLYNPLIAKAANFMVGFTNEFNLPYPSYDIWEMKLGTHTFTTAAVIASMEAASKFAELLGKKDDQDRYLKAASNFREAARKHFYNQDRKYFYKYVDFTGDATLHDETIDVSSFYGMFKFGIYEVDDPILTEAEQTMSAILRCSGDCGGFARFENDRYYRVHPETPGNPWIISNLWYAQYLIAKAKTLDDLIVVEKCFTATIERAKHSGILPEQYDPYNGAPISVSPLTWSHAEYVTTMIEYLDKLKELKQKNE